MAKSNFTLFFQPNRASPADIQKYLNVVPSISAWTRQKAPDAPVPQDTR